MTLLESYARVVGDDVIDQLQQLAGHLNGATIVHVNSTRVGGGVAEILAKLVPLSAELGLNAPWEVITGSETFYQCTKTMHNALQGNRVDLTEEHINAYEQANAENADLIRDLLREADFVFIHDPQPAPLIKHVPDRKGKWIWRCHIDASRPHRPVWKYLRNYVGQYDATVFSLASFAQVLPSPQYIVPPSIDPLADKNRDLEQKEIDSVYTRFSIDPHRPLLVQVSRFDRFKDPVGVIHAYRMTKRFLPTVQLVLAGGTATDDPEGDAVLEEVRAAADNDPDVKILLLPPDAHITINALQRAADIVLQKSTREGFGLTVTEGLWKGKPVIGGNTGGIKLQVIDYHTGFLVNSPEGAALRIRYLLHQKALTKNMGRKAREFVRENFLLTRQLREYLTLLVATKHGAKDRIELA